MKKMRTAALLLFAFALSVSNAGAWCLGLSGTKGSGDFDLKGKKFLSTQKNQIEGNLERTGLALIWETSCATDDLFTGRVGLAFEKSVLSPDGTTDKEDISELSADLGLGIRLFANDLLRVWAGPTFRMGSAGGEGGPNLGDTSARVLGFGLEAGANFHVFANVDLALTLGARSEQYLAEQDNMPHGGDLSGNAEVVYTTLTVFFRSDDDNFSRPEPIKDGEEK